MHVLCGTVAWIFRFGVSTTKTFNQSNIWILQRRAWWNNNDCYIWNLFPDVFSWRYGCLSPTQNLNLIVPISRDVDPTFLCLDLLEVTWLMEEILMDAFIPLFETRCLSHPNRLPGFLPKRMRGVIHGSTAFEPHKQTEWSTNPFKDVFWNHHFSVQYATLVHLGKCLIIILHFHQGLRYSYQIV